MARTIWSGARADFRIDEDTRLDAGLKVGDYVRIEFTDHLGERCLQSLFRPPRQMAQEVAMSSIFEATRKGDATAVEVFLRYDKAALHERARQGETPLHVAVEFSHVYVARLLMEAGADVNARNAEGRRRCIWPWPCRSRSHDAPPAGPRR